MWGVKSLTGSLVLKILVVVGMLLVLVMGLVILSLVPWYYTEDKNVNQRMKISAGFKYAGGVDSCKSMVDQFMSLTVRDDQGNICIGGGSMCGLERDVRSGLMESCVMAASAYQENLTMCSSIYDESECFDNLLLNLRSRDKLIKACNTTKENLQSICALYLSIANNDTSECLNQRYEFIRGECFHYMAYRTHNISLCINGRDYENKECENVLTYLNNHSIESFQTYKPRYMAIPQTGLYTIMSIYNISSELCDKSVQGYEPETGDLTYWYKYCLKYASYD
jgi:hypothetical protein